MLTLNIIEIIFKFLRYVQLQESSFKKVTSQRQLAKLQSLLQSVEMQCNDVNKQIYSNWLESDDAKKVAKKYVSFNII